MKVWGLMMCWFVTGFFCGSIDTGLNTLIVWLWKENVNSFMQLLHCKFVHVKVFAKFA